MLDGPDEDGGGALAEKSPHEPDEFDPSSLGPDVPTAPAPPDGNADSDVAPLFWKLVAVFNIALLGLSVGPMLAYFEGRVELGLRIFLVGLVVFGYGTLRYVQFRRSRDDESAADGGAVEDDSAAETAGGGARDDAADDSTADHDPDGSTADRNG